MLGELDVGIHPMRYPMRAASPPVAGLDTAADLSARLRSLEFRMQEREQQFTRELEEARRAGFDRGKEEALGEQAAQREQSAAQLSQAVDEFCARREEYLSRVEQEVVRLALAIAERVIRREAQMDPLLLAGVVRVALGQLAESTRVRLRIPVEQEEMWAETLRLMPGLHIRPEVVGDPDLHPCEAVLESTVGVVNLGVRAQLAEIERGFFDLLDARREKDNCRDCESPNS